MAYLNDYLGTTETTVIAGTASELKIPASIFFRNTDTATRTVTIYEYGAGGSAIDKYSALSFDIPAGDTMDYLDGGKRFIGENDKISALADVVDKVAVKVNYIVKAV